MIVIIALVITFLVILVKVDPINLTHLFVCAPTGHKWKIHKKSRPNFHRQDCVRCGYWEINMRAKVLAAEDY
jgi:hypothetical protein